ncbi:hypothetical protein PISMIDRAFT_688196 [Pisolithus microcarpus 441]|uniref:Uncharacterized protein n=1 Tax=Pisolithus microcarpus 441 TaxID=765257 RepID=A0A0C9XNZ9_9AGAM|nr:hypothetical protein PISMIDRAFT_688196 [Pisolithus microcarpus 441]
MQGLGLGYYSDLSDQCTDFLVTLGPALHGFSRTTKRRREEPSVTQHLPPTSVEPRYSTMDPLTSDVNC